MTPEQIANDVAARIRVADQEAHDAAAAFHFGKWGEYWAAKQEVIQKQIEADRDAAIAAIESTKPRPSDSSGAGASLPNHPEVT